MPSNREPHRPKLLKKSIVEPDIGFSGRPNLRELVELGIEARKKGDRSAALAYFETIIGANPRHVRARIEAARELRHISRVAEADAMLRSVLADDPDHVDCLVELAALLHERARLAEAGETLRRVIKLQPNNAKALLQLSRIALGMGDEEQSVLLLKKAAAVNPSHAGTQIAVALQCRDQGQLRLSRELLEALIVLYPKHMGAWMQLGLLERVNGDRESALAAFSKVADRDPDYVRAWVEIAIENRVLGRPHESEQAINRALAIDPTNLSALLQSAEHAFLAQNEEGSLEIYQRIIKLHPADTRAYIGASRMAANLGRDAEAFQYLDRGEQFASSDPAIATRRAQLLRLTGEWPRARAVIESRADDCYRDFSLWQEAVALFLAMGDHAAVEEALPRAPGKTRFNSAWVHEVRGRLAEARWDFAGAISHYRQAVELNPSVATFRIELARAHLLTLDLPAAREQLKSSIELSTSRRLLRGESQNVSQTYLGQILNEFALDADLVNRLRDALARPGDAQIQELQAIVRSAPDSTPAAIMLLTKLRQAGLLSREKTNGVSDGSTRIPQRVVQYWDAQAPPRQIVEVMQTWRQIHAGWDYQRFDDKLARDFLRTKLPIDVLRAYLRAPHPAQKSDVFRLAYLYCEGGFYADADDRCLAPLNEIVPGDVDLAAYQEGYGSIGNNFLGASAGHPVIERALHLAVEAINRGDNDVYWLSTGPGLLSRTIAQFLAEPNGSAELLRHATILESGELARSVAVHCTLTYKSTDRHWVKSAFGGGKPAVAAAQDLPPKMPAIEHSISPVSNFASPSHV